MFEKEAEEYFENFADCANCKERWGVCADLLDEYCLANGSCYATPKEQDIYIAGAEYGYNKANEWHYVKDGDLPKDEKDVQVLYQDCDKVNSYTCLYDIHSESWSYYNLDECLLEPFDYEVIAWKEIVLPKESE